MLSPSAETVRLFLHLLAAAVWVGGQVVMAGLVPELLLGVLLVAHR